jgi:toxin FitB
MILLDTNVVSETLKARPDARVLAWLAAQADGDLYVASVSMAELWAGIALMPIGKRRAALETAVREHVGPEFAGRVLSFDEAAAQAYGETFARTQSRGNRMEFADCALAALAISRGYSLATRNTQDFRFSGVSLIDPWAG